MSRVSPTLEGFRAAFRRPSLTFAEIAWRWTVGGVGWALSIFWFLEYLDTLPVSKSDMVLLATRQPFLVGQAIAHIVRGSLNRAAMAGLLAVLATSLLWVVLAAMGRAATIRALLDYFRRDSASDFPAETSSAAAPRPLRSLIGLNFLRAAVVLATVLALVGAAVLASFASPEANPHPGLAFVIFLPLAVLVCFILSTLNWLLSLAGLFAVRDGEDTAGAIAAAVFFFRAHLGAVSAVSTWIGLAHLTAFSVATTAVSIPLALLQVAPSRLVIAGVILVTLALFGRRGLALHCAPRGIRLHRRDARRSGVIAVACATTIEPAVHIEDRDREHNRSR